ncbi:hypothetical protein FRC07_007212 [Ceratobasidium sp. 392]|nr:hypothetical protein FRC07_007212 [Ceratobasidium sp. 392]
MTTPGENDIDMDEPQVPEQTNAGSSADPQRAPQEHPTTLAQTATPQLFTAPTPLPNQPPPIQLRVATQLPTLSNGAFRNFPRVPPRPSSDPNPRPAKRAREYEENHPIVEANFGNIAPSTQFTQMAGRPPNMATLQAGLIDATRQLAQPRPPPAHPQSNAAPITPRQDIQSSPPASSAPQSTASPPNNTSQPDSSRPGPPQPSKLPTNASQSHPGGSQQNPTQSNPSQPPKPSSQPSNSPLSHIPQPAAGQPSSGRRQNVMDTDSDADDEDEDFGVNMGGDNAGNVDLQKIFSMMTKMAQQQKAIAKSLKNNQQTDTGNMETEEPREKPRRVSPPKPREVKDWDQSVPCSTPAGRQPREARRAELLRIVRKAIAELVGHTDKKKPFPPSPPTNVRFPTQQKFFIRWEETEKSTFNRLAAGIAFDYIKEKWADEKFTEAEIANLALMVPEHIRYLCRTVKKSSRLDAAERKKADLKRASAASRRKTIYESRLKVVDSFPESLGKFRQLLVQIGVDGTSSDEEDPERKGVYLIRRRPELSTKVQVLKSQFDKAYVLYIKGPGTRGSQIHIRESSNIESTRRYTAEGLPVSCLSRHWYKTLSAPEREFYGFVDYEYDFIFPKNFLDRKTSRTPEDIVMSEDEVDEDL